jgi:REP element-mobilizing transposase RayT
MTYDPDIHRRHSIRMKGYDYSQAGMYFLTICTHGRTCLFGEIENNIMRPNDAGNTVQATWETLPEHYAHVTLDVFVVMPNHVHGIVALNASARDSLESAVTARYGLSEIVRAFKAFSARRINNQQQTHGSRIWQRNYWEHIVRNDIELKNIREYIQTNPAQWELDELHQQMNAGTM